MRFTQQLQALTQGHKAYQVTMRTSATWQVWNEHGSDEECLALVVHTGLYTTMGSMLRQVMAPAHAVYSLRDPFIVVRVSHLTMHACMLVTNKSVLLVNMLVKTLCKCWV